MFRLWIIHLLNVCRRSSCNCNSVFSQSDRSFGHQITGNLIDSSLQSFDLNSVDLASILLSKSFLIKSLRPSSFGFNNILMFQLYCSRIKSGRGKFAHLNRQISSYVIRFLLFKSFRLGSMQLDASDGFDAFNSFDAFNGSDACDSCDASDGLILAMVLMLSIVWVLAMVLILVMIRLVSLVLNGMTKMLDILCLIVFV